MLYIAYYRVSTQRQGLSGLGIEAQKIAVTQFVNTHTDNVIAAYTDIESGKNDQRPQLKLAIEAAKKYKAQLLIAKLDRLSRHAAFIFTLRDSKVEFVCCDMPNANSITIGIMAVLAQDERERISQRTKAALQVAKQQGKKLGNPNSFTSDIIAKGHRVKKENAINNDNNKKATSLILSMRNSGASFYQITNELNNAGFTTRNGCVYRQIQVHRLYDRANKIKEAV